jgi:hypothetical protein
MKACSLPTAPRFGALSFASSGGHTGSFWQTQATERRRVWDSP